MNLIDALSSGDKQNIIDYINHYSDAHATAPIENILHYWSCAKRDLFEMFGNNLILSKTIDFQKSANEIENEMFYKWDRYNSSYNKFFNELRSEMSRVSSYEDEFYDTCAKLFNYGYLSCNEYAGDSFKVILPNDKSIVVEAGCRPMRILGRIAEAYDLKEEFEPFRLEHSQIFNQKTSKGTLCLSIHPLDFMTMSDNECDWDSCMSWKESGCYRAGTVEMMNSPIVIVAYLRASKDMDLFNDNSASWNNKKWRCLFIVDDALVTSVKGYPYRSTPLNEEVIKWINELRGGQYSQIQHIKSYDVECGRYDMKYWEDNHLYFSTDQMYNDFGTCDIDIAFSNAFLEAGPSSLNIHYSGATTCVCCGEEKDTTDEESLCCNTCLGKKKCPICGYYMDDDDMDLTPDEEYICNDCFSQRYYYDHILDNNVAKEEDTVTIYVAVGQDSPRRPRKITPSLYSEEKWDAFFKIPFNQFHKYTDNDSWCPTPLLFVYRHELTSYGAFELFGLR